MLPGNSAEPGDTDQNCKMPAIYHHRYDCILPSIYNQKLQSQNLSVFVIFRIISEAIYKKENEETETKSRLLLTI